MLSQANDFYQESEYIYSILENLSNNDFRKVTQFKSWTFNTIIRHLHVWNYASYLSLEGEDNWKKFREKLNFFFSNNKTLKDFEEDIVLPHIKDKELLMLWKEFYLKLTETFKFEEPKKRVKWVGPDMSVLSSISARHMETWAHGQAIFDILGIERINHDRIYNIVIIGNNTFNWAFKINNKEIPSEPPYLKLYSPSGKVWEFNNSNNINKIEGKAEEFCQVVTQVRNIKDVHLKLLGPISNQWMQIAQCFAGKASKPPVPGLRKVMLNK